MMDLCVWLWEEIGHLADKSAQTSFIFCGNVHVFENKGWLSDVSSHPQHIHNYMMTIFYFW